MIKKHTQQDNKAQSTKLASHTDAGTEVARIPTPTLTNSDKLTVAESKELADIENRIATNISSVFELGQDLYDIQTRKLWKQSYKSFDDYCKKRWDYGRSYCSRLLNAKSVIDDLKTVTIGNNLLPKNEGQARVFVNLDKQQRINLIEKVGEELGDKFPNASIFQKYKRKLFPTQCIVATPKTKDTEKVMTAAPAIHVLDVVGFEKLYEAGWEVLENLPDNESGRALKGPLNDFILLARSFADQQKEHRKNQN